MSLDTLIRDKVAVSLVYLYKRLGKTIVFQNRDEDPVTLYADYKPEAIDLANSLGMNVERTERMFYIPRQPGFPPDGGVNIGDTISVGSIDYQVERVEAAGGEMPQLEISTTRKRPVNAGVI